MLLDNKKEQNNINQGTKETLFLQFVLFFSCLLQPSVL